MQLVARSRISFCVSQWFFK